jgi:catechol 2,3-dioxygenase-like lactoylglutathione lyase family enzyme
MKDFTREFKDSICCASQMPREAKLTFHVSLRVKDLQKSIDFYRIFFGFQPIKQYADYAKFEVEEPPLVLSLIPGRLSTHAPLSGLLVHFLDWVCASLSLKRVLDVVDHLGLRVPASPLLVEVQRRLDDETSYWTG